MGKGSKQRPTDKAAYESSYERIFHKKSISESKSKENNKHGQAGRTSRKQ